MDTWPIVCTECFDGTGHYVADGDTATCKTCGHTVSLSHDVTPYLDDNERLTVRDGVVHVVSTD